MYKYRSILSQIIFEIITKIFITLSLLQDFISLNRDDRDGYGRGGFGGGGRGFSAADDDRSWRRDEPEIPVRRDIREERSERPKLNILPRSKPADENSGS